MGTWEELTALISFSLFILPVIPHENGIGISFGFYLSDDPDKNYSIFYCSAAIRFPHIEMVVFSDQEFINRWKAGL